MNHRAVGDDCDLASVAQEFRLAYLKQLRLSTNVRAHAASARVAHRCGACVLDHRVEHVAHLALVLRGHGDDVRDGAQVGDVEEAVVRRPVAADDACAIHAELDVQVLKTNVVDDLVECALQESRVDGADGFESLG